MPEFYTVPESYLNKEVTWIELIAKEFTSQSSYARGSNTIRTGETLAVFKLLAPNQIAENVAHEWGEYESIPSRIANKVGDIKKAVSEAKGVVNALTTGYETVKGQAGSENIAASNLIGKIAGSAQVDVPKYKIDSALTYQNSGRREYSLTFNFAYVYGDKSAEDAVFKPIRKLEELSCAELDEGLINIKFPAVFRINTIPGDLIKINYAVLTAVQPTWTGPYKNGYPISCELQLTFTDVEPLYRRSFSQGGIVTVNGESGNTEADDVEELG